MNILITLLYTLSSKAFRKELFACPAFSRPAFSVNRNEPRVLVMIMYKPVNQYFVMYD